MDVISLIKKVVKDMGTILDYTDTQVDCLESVVTVSEAAKRLGTYEVDVRRQIYSGKLRARKSGGTWLVLL